MQNIERKNLLSDVEIEEIMRARRTEGDLESLTKENDEADGDLKIAIRAKSRRCWRSPWVSKKMC